MITINLKALGKDVGPAVEYLRSRSDDHVQVKGSQVKLPHTSARVAKLLLHKFLRQLRLEEYRIVVVHSGLIDVRSPEKEKRRPARHVEGAKPSAWETIPDLWYTTPPGIIRPAKRSKREMKRKTRGL
jgi:hypothetical protein